jgi:hypothetical protein
VQPDVQHVQVRPGSMQQARAVAQHADRCYGPAYARRRPSLFGVCWPSKGYLSYGSASDRHGQESYLLIRLRGATRHYLAEHMHAVLSPCACHVCPTLLALSCVQ